MYDMQTFALDLRSPPRHPRTIQAMPNENAVDLTKSKIFSKVPVPRPDLGMGAAAMWPHNEFSLDVVTWSHCTADVCGAKIAQLLDWSPCRQFERF